jgi:2-methylcitrate dehydratase PrpD
MPKIEAYLLPKDVPTFSGRVELESVQGQNFVIEVPHPYGSPGNPLGWEGEISKFHACAALMPQALKNSQLEKVVDLCQHFEELDDVSVLIDALCV